MNRLNAHLEAMLRGSVLRSPKGPQVLILATAALAISATSARASDLCGEDQHPVSAKSTLAPVSAASTEGANQLVMGYLKYIEALKARSDLSFERMQSSVGISLQRISPASVEVTSTYPDGGSATLSFWNEGHPKSRSASLELVNDRSPNLMAPQCRLSFDSLRERLLRAGYDEMREWSHLEEAGGWLYFKGDIWIEVGTGWISTSPLDRKCVSTIDAHERFQAGDGSI